MIAKTHITCPGCGGELLVQGLVDHGSWERDGWMGTVEDIVLLDPPVSPWDGHCPFLDDARNGAICNTDVYRLAFDTLAEIPADEPDIDID